MANEDNVVRLKHLTALGSAILDKVSDFAQEGGSSQATGYDALFVPAGASVIINAPTVTVPGDTVTVAADPKDIPSLTLGGWSIADTVYSAVVSYSGDGALSVNNGTITNGTLTVNDADGTFNGVISAAEGTNFAPAKLYFDYDTNTVTQTVGGGGKPIPALTVGNWDGFTAPITYTGDGALSVIGGALSSTLLTASDKSGIIYARETDNFAAAITDWQWSSDSLLVAYLPFTVSTTGDLCGGNWVAYGNPVIQDGALYLDGSSYLSLDDGLTLGGQDFTIDFWYKGEQIIVGSYLFGFGTGPSTCITIQLLSSGTLHDVGLLAWNGSGKVSSEKYSVDDWRHFAIVYQHAKTMTTCYLDGVQVVAQECTIPATTAPFIIGAYFNGSRCAKGPIKNFRIFNDVALWTEDFTPPSASDY